MLSFPLPEGAALEVAKARPDLTAYFAEVQGFNEKIVEKALKEMKKESVFLRVVVAWQSMFDMGAGKMMPVGEKALSDYDHIGALISRHARYQRFRDWVTKVMKDREMLDAVLKEMVQRQMHHWCSHYFHKEEIITEQAMIRMRGEFKLMNWNSTTRYLFSMFVGLQTVLFEIFVIEDLLKRLDD